MSATPPHNEQDAKSAFEAQADKPQVGLIGEFWDFICYHKRWWLIPIVIVTIVVSALVVLAGTGAAPFIYTLF